jgi:hypothetical protein
MYFLPYIDFSTQVPYFSATAWSAVGEESEVEIELAGEFVDRTDLVRRDPDHPRARLRIIGAAVADAAGLGRATRGVGARVKKQYERLI